MVYARRVEWQGIAGRPNESIPLVTANTGGGGVATAASGEGHVPHPVAAWPTLVAVPGNGACSSLAAAWAARAIHWRAVRRGAPGGGAATAAAVASDRPPYVADVGIGLGALGVERIGGAGEVRGAQHGQGRSGEEHRAEGVLAWPMGGSVGPFSGYGGIQGNELAASGQKSKAA